MTEKKKGRWLLPASLVVILAVVAAAMIGSVTRAKPLPTPHEAMRKAVDSLEPLPDPVTLGVLGQGEMGGERFGVSGNLNLQTGKNGLELSLTDFTLGYEDGSTDLEVYINSEVAAVHIPELLGETWYGVDFMKGLKVQATEVVSEELVDWYFDDGGLSEAQAAVKELRAALAKIKQVGLSEGEKGSLWAFFAKLEGDCRRQEDGDGYVLQFSATGEQIADLLNDYNWKVPFNTSEPAPADPAHSVMITPTDSRFTFHVDSRYRLTYLDITPQGSDQPFLMLDLGDPDEPSPRLEVQWWNGNSIELAFTISDGTTLTAPKFTNAFDLLNLLSLGE